MFQFQVLVKGKQAEKHVITRKSGLKPLARGVGRQKPSSIARQVVLNHRIRPHILRHLGKHIQKELTHMCSERAGKHYCTNVTPCLCTSMFAGSLLRQTSLLSFSWDDEVADLQKHAPTLYGVLRVCAEVKKRQRNVKKAHKQANLSSVLGICGAVLLRNKSARMNLIQRLISVILSAGHASKMVCGYIFCPLQFLLNSIDLRTSAEDVAVFITQIYTQSGGRARARSRLQDP